MNQDELFSRIFQRGTEAGLEEMEVQVQRKSTLRIMVFNSEIDDYKVSDEHVLSMRGTYNGKTGYSFTEKADNASIESLIHNVREYAENSNFYEPVADGTAAESHAGKLKDENVALEDKMQLVLDMEAKAFQSDSRIASVNRCVYSEEQNEVVIKNSKGIDIKDATQSISTSISVVAKEGTEVKTGNSTYNGTYFADIHPETIVKRAVADATGLIQARSMKSGKQPVILRNNVAASILQAYSRFFSSGSVQNNISLLKGKLEEKVSSEQLTITDDPSFERGLFLRQFDDEGTPTEKKTIISNGILKNYLYNHKNALKDGVPSTGNGFRSSHKSTIGVSPTNMFIQPGENSLDEIISTIDYGTIIIDVQALHAGLNSVTGDFSLAAHGFFIEDGKISRPVNQITVGGNFYDMLHDIVHIGDDLIFNHPGNGCVGSPSLKINDLMIGGL